MAIIYEQEHKSTLPSSSSPFLHKLRHINEAFEAEGISVMNEGYSEVAVNAHYHTDYVTRLSEDMTPEMAAEFATLAENTRLQTLTEASIGSINPITALSLPMLRVAYPKTAVREGLPTEPVKQPKFKVTWHRPYVIDPVDNSKHYLPKAFRTKAHLFGLPQLQSDMIAIPAGGLFGYDLMTPVNANASMGDMIDPVFNIVAVEVSDGTETKVVDVDFGLDTNINVVEGEATVTLSGTEHKVRVFGKVDRLKGLLDVVGLGAAVTVTGVKVRGYLSSEMNNRATVTSFEITAEETTIGTGQPIESPINIQAITDTMAQYNIDMTVRLLEIMSSSLAQSTDMEGVNFLERCYQQSEQKISDSFNVDPPANYLLGPTEWREQLKIKIDHVVTRLMALTNITSGHAVIFMNPIDSQVLHNVKWQYTQGENVNGVNIEYRVGSYQSGVTTYTVLSSFNFAQGSFYIQYLPSSEDLKTAVYYPYSFNTIRAASSPNNPNVPAIQMIKRHTFKKYTSMIGKIAINGNSLSAFSN